jgi:L-lactate dehydrogenase complex protein LldE
LFVTCIVDQLFPKVGMDMADVLERLGYQVDFPESQTCCGQPAFNSGYRDEARTVARHFLDTFESSECIVAPSGSCTSMVAHHFAELFQKEPETLARVHSLEKRIWEFSTFLTEVAGVEDVGARLEDVVTFHDSCHGLRELGIKDGPRRLLARVRGPGIAGNAAGRRVLRVRRHIRGEVRGAFRRHGPHQDRRHPAHRRQHRGGLDLSCLMQIQGALSRAGSKVRTMHLAEVLASR